MESATAESVLPIFMRSPPFTEASYSVARKGSKPRNPPFAWYDRPMRRDEIPTRVTERFFARVSKGGKGCLIFNGYRDKHGYARCSWRDSSAPSGQRTIEGHRMAYILDKGDLPSDDCLIHACGQRACVNVAHLVRVTREAHTKIILPDARRKAMGKG